MSKEKNFIVFDFSFLSEASKKLHGYLLRTWFMLYLDILVGNLRRWIKHGLLGPDGKPTEESDYLLLFDINAINIEKITYIIGFYIYILSGHKKANYSLMQKDEKKRVFYLRGFDYESAVKNEEGLGIGHRSMDTMMFNQRLGEHLYPDFEIFKSLSPGDLFWETAGAQRCFRGDFTRLIYMSGEPIRSIYFNSNYWQADIDELVERMDYFVVYVSSFTESVLWELDLLKRKQRTHHTTVVFDDKAIANRKILFDIPEWMKGASQNEVLWSSKQTESYAFTTEELRDWLGQSFLVVSPDDFFSNIEWHKTRIRKSNSLFGIGAREAPLPFRFFPAQNADALKEIYDFDESVEILIRQQISSKGITNLPWFLNNIQMKIYTSIMLGKHDETGHALAVYAAVMNVVRKQLFVVHTPGDDITEEHEKHPDELALQEHFEMARHASFLLLAYGKSHEFGDFSANALEIYEEIFSSSTDAIEYFFHEAYRRRRG
jgi:hypothetical protein